MNSCSEIDLPETAYTYISPNLGFILTSTPSLKFTGHPELHVCKASPQAEKPETKNWEKTHIHTHTQRYAVSTVDRL